MAATFRNVRRRLRALTIGLPLMLMTAGAAVGAPGDLDLTFGRGGRVFINMDANAETAAPLVQQGDGRLLLGRGTNFMVATGVDLSVVRLNPDGRPDADFGGNGMASTDVPGITASTRVVVRQDADKIIVAGPAWSDDNPNRVFAAIVRYLADGTLDATFGSRGVLLEDFGATGASIDALVVLPDGRLVAAGYADTPGGRRDMAFARFNSNGSIDTTFGSNGHLIVEFGGARRDDFAYAGVRRAFVRRTDGGLIAAGTAYSTTGSPYPVLLALTADGVVDSSFGTAGRASPYLTDAYMHGSVQIGLQSDGKIVLAGIVERGARPSCELIVTRMDQQGSLDPSFGNAGFTMLPASSCTLPFDVIVTPDNRILIGAESAYDNPFGYGAWDYGVAQKFDCPCNLEVLRMTANGMLDVAFGVNGMASIDLGVDNVYSNVSALAGTHLVQLTDGNIAVATTGHYDDEYSILDGEPWSHPGIAVARLLNSGASPGLVGFKEMVVTVLESQPTVFLKVQRTGGAAGDVSVQFTTSDVTTRSGLDYAPSSGTLTWADGDTTDKAITIAITDDTQPEEGESLGVTLSGLTGGAFLATSIGGVDIGDNDPMTTTAPVPSAVPGSSPGSSSGGGGGAVDWVQLVALATVLIGAKRRNRSATARVRLTATR